MKVLLGPTNYANQPVALTRALRAAGEDAHHVLYAWSGRQGYRFDHDRVCELGHEDWLAKQWATVNWALEEGVEVFHLWNRSLVHPRGGFGFFSGLDLPYLKASGAKTLYRFTGYDLRRRSVDMEVNPYSPFHAGYQSPYDEAVQEDYLAYLRDWVDALVVQDPEMRVFLPEARILPRGVDLSAFSCVGVSGEARPLVVHAPSSPQLKGSDHVIKAVETLRHKQVRFDFKLIHNMTHHEAVQWYRRADIVIDQLLVGWYGVLSIEAMALGKPVLAYVREPLYSEFRPAIPVVNVTVDSLVDELHSLLENPERRERLGHEGRRFVEGVHDIQKVADAARRMYRETSAKPTSSADGAVRYLRTTGQPAAAALRKAERWDRVAGELPLLRRKAKKWDRLERLLGIYILRACRRRLTFSRRAPKQGPGR